MRERTDKLNLNGTSAVPPQPQVQVRLLTAIPRIDGLQEALSPKRARRAIEVVAYLGLHRPDPVTSDRLRTRVLGTRESDAAAKTLFNTIGAARRALGLDSTGSNCFHLRLNRGTTACPSW